MEIVSTILMSGLNNYWNYTRFNPRPFWPSGIVAFACLHVSVSVSIPKVVRTITCHPFKLEPLNLDFRCKTPCLISLLFWKATDLKGHLKLQIYPHFEFVCTIIHQMFKLGSPNLDQRCKALWLRSLLFWSVIDLDMQCQILPKKLKFHYPPFHHQSKYTTSRVNA